MRLWTIVAPRVVAVDGSLRPTEPRATSLHLSGSVCSSRLRVPLGKRVMERQKDAMKSALNMFGKKNRRYGGDPDVQPQCGRRGQRVDWWIDNHCIRNEILRPASLRRADSHYRRLQPADETCVYGEQTHLDKNLVEH